VRFFNACELPPVEVGITGSRFVGYSYVVKLHLFATVSHSGAIYKTSRSKPGKKYAFICGMLSFISPDHNNPHQTKQSTSTAHYPFLTFVNRAKQQLQSSVPYPLYPPK